MTVHCPQGHASDTDDFCDECGLPIAATAGAAAAAVPAGPPPASSPEGFCPLCGTPRSGRFCEEDGHDFVLSGAAAAPPEPAPPEPAAAPPAEPPGSAAGTWVVVVDADRHYFDTVLAREGPDIGEVAFPTYYPRAEVPLAGSEVRVGRRRVSGSTPPPQVDLAGPPLDPGVSHLHAVLLPDDDGGWSVLDPGSTNGTTVNDADEPIAADRRVRLAPGDRIHVGAFTTLTVERR